MGRPCKWERHNIKWERLCNFRKRQGGVRWEVPFQTIIVCPVHSLGIRFPKVTFPVICLEQCSPKPLPWAPSRKDSIDGVFQNYHTECNLIEKALEITFWLYLAWSMPRTYENYIFFALIPKRYPPSSEVRSGVASNTCQNREQAFELLPHMRSGRVSICSGMHQDKEKGQTLCVWWSEALSFTRRGVVLAFFRNGLCLVATRMGPHCK